MRSRIVQSVVVALSVIAILLSGRFGQQNAGAQLFYPVQVTAGGPYSGLVGAPVTMSASTGYVPLGALPVYVWNLGDGSVAYGPSVVHIYSVPGTFPVSLTVSGLAGSGFSQTSAVISSALQVSAGIPISAYTGVPVPFAASFVGNVTPQFSWTFGDGSTTSGQTVSHTYVSPGSYNAVVTAVDPATGQADTDSIAVTIRQAMVVDANGPYSGTAGLPIQFGATLNGATRPEYRWDFGDGQTGSGANPSHTFNQAGSYTATLYATDSASSQSASDTAGVSVLSGGPVVFYPAGWNLVAAPQGTPFAKSGTPLYTFRPGDTDYEVVRAATGVTSGYGYWAYFSQPTMVTLSGMSADSAAVQVPGGTYTLIGNPSATSVVKIHDAAYAMSWDPILQTYKQVSYLPPGTAAWVFVSTTDVVSVEP